MVTRLCIDVLTTLPRMTSASYKENICQMKDSFQVPILVIKSPTSRLLYVKHCIQLLKVGKPKIHISELAIIFCPFPTLQHSPPSSDHDPREIERQTKDGLDPRPTTMFECLKSSFKNFSLPRSWIQTC